MVPSGVRSLVESGHTVLVEKSAGKGSGILDEEYIAAGAKMVPSAEAVFKESDLIIKVKEPLPSEFDLFREEQMLFTYLHLAADLELTEMLLKKKIIGIAYETVQLEDGSLPLLTPMSEIAGKLSIQIGAHFLLSENGGSGVLLGGVPGVTSANVTIIGGGVVGTNAAKVALGMGASVTILDVNLNRLRHLSDMLVGNLTLLNSNADNIEYAVTRADLVIGAILTPGAMAKKIVTRNMVSQMRNGSVIFDVAIDQGGCFDTSVPTTHDKPVFLVDGVLSYCVTNIPSCVPRTSTFALTNATLPYALKLANLGYKETLRTEPALRKGINICKGKVVNQTVAKSLGLDYTPYEMCK